MGIASLHEAARHLFGKALSAVATHSHLDHVGSLHEFGDRIVHRAEAGTLTKPSENFSMLRDEHPVEMIAAIACSRSCICPDIRLGASACGKPQRRLSSRGMRSTTRRSAAQAARAGLSRAARVAAGRRTYVRQRTDASGGKI
jgi:hypothetical protein